MTPEAPSFLELREGDIFAPRLEHSIEPAILQRLLPIAAPPVYCAINHDGDAIREHETMGPWLSLIPSFAETFLQDPRYGRYPGKIVRWDQAWAIARKILARQNGRSAEWVKAIQNDLRGKHRAASPEVIDVIAKNSALPPL